jgi:solute carrier family 12 sodium/potassium/chloride transporter 2
MSRILGPEFGGSIGLIFALANAINASLNVVGFVQTVQDAMWNYGGYIIVDGDLNDTRILGTILLILVWALCGAGAKYEAKVFRYTMSFKYFLTSFKNCCSCCRRKLFSSFSW